MCQYSAENGFVGEWHSQWLGSLATGGHGLVFTEDTAICPEGRHSLSDAGMWRDEHAATWEPLVAFGRSRGAVMGIQLGHAGRKASVRPPWHGHSPLTLEEGGWTSMGPSDVAHAGHPAPRVMNRDDIENVIDNFVQAARRSVQAGFQVIEIHSGHGYLLHQFLSPLSNFRTDEYGGSFENRTRLLLRVLESIRQEVGQDVPLFVRLSSTDYVEGGWTIEDTIDLAKELKRIGCDLVDCSSGGLVPIQLTEADVGPGYQVSFSQAVRETAQIATGAVGLITDASQAESILAAGAADAIFVARAAMRNPYFALNAAENLGEVIDWPQQLVRARTVR